MKTSICLAFNQTNKITCGILYLHERYSCHVLAVAHHQVYNVIAMKMPTPGCQIISRAIQNLERCIHVSLVWPTAQNTLSLFNFNVSDYPTIKYWPTSHWVTNPMTQSQNKTKFWQGRLDLGSTLYQAALATS